MYCYESIIIILIKLFSIHLSFKAVICHLWYRFSIDNEVLHSVSYRSQNDGIEPSPLLSYLNYRLTALILSKTQRFTYKQLVMSKVKVNS